MAQSLGNIIFMCILLYFHSLSLCSALFIFTLFFFHTIDQFSIAQLKVSIIIIIFDGDLSLVEEHEQILCVDVYIQCRNENEWSIPNRMHVGLALLHHI